MNDDNNLWGVWKEEKREKERRAALEALMTSWKGASDARVRTPEQQRIDILESRVKALEAELDTYRRIISE